MKSFKNLIYLLISFLFCNLQYGCSERQNYLTITSSTQLLSLAETLALDFRHKSQNNLLSVSVKGSLGQEEDLLNKDLTDLLISERDLSIENNNLSSQIIATDQLIIISHPENNLKEIKLESLQKIFSGEITNWYKINKHSETIQVLSREAGSPIRKEFERAFLNNNLNISLSALIVNSNPEMRSAIASIKGSIGYISIGSLNESVQSLKIINIDNTEIKMPTENIYLIWKTNNQKPELISFLDYFKNNKSSNQIIKEQGFMPNQ